VLMKTIHFLFITGIAILTIFSSCKKDEPVDPCTNGFLDPGEDAPDCGGNCPPCSSIEQIYLGLKVNGTSVVMSNKDLEYDGSNWILSMSNDSLNFSFNLGSSGNVGSYAMPYTGTLTTFNGTLYPNKSNGSYVISQHDTENNQMSGFFQIDFSRMGFTDTLHVTDGTFEYFIY